MQRQFRSIQRNPGAAEKKTAYFGCSQCIIKKLFDFSYDQTDRIFIVGTPVNPSFFLDVLDQSQDGFAAFWWRLYILCALRALGANRSMSDAKPRRMIWPETLVLPHKVLP